MTRSEFAPPTQILSAAMVHRRLEVDRKQALISQLLKDTGCEGLLLLQPANYRWFTSGATPQGFFDPAETPVIFANPNNRWIFASNVDSQRLFDEEVDLLGFQLKEFHWTHSRNNLLYSLSHNRKVACDKDFRECVNVSNFLEQERRKLSSYELTLYLELGRMMIQSLEATMKGIKPGDTEEEVIGHLAHRLYRQGIEPAALQINSDGRGEIYRRGEAKNRPILRDCCVQVTGCLFGLFVTASRTVSFGPPDESLRNDFEIATRMSTIYAASLKLGDPLSKGIRTGKEFPANQPAEHEWRLAPPGYLTGRQVSEQLLTLTSLERLQENVPIIWQSRIGQAGVCDTFVHTNQGWKIVTDLINWPMRTIIVDGITWKRPEILIRK